MLIKKDHSDGITEMLRLYQDFGLKWAMTAAEDSAKSCPGHKIFLWHLFSGQSIAKRWHCIISGRMGNGPPTKHYCLRATQAALELFAPTTPRSDRAQGGKGIKSRKKLQEGIWNRE